MIEALGILALGVFLGYMAWYFATRVTDSWMDSFAAVAGVLFGGVVLAFLGGTSSDSRWWYPIGLVIGWVIYVVLRVAAGKGVPALTMGRGLE
jgi:phosphotransferase system  glucose/maltose/N-acetylglucosamine-specific IIC component